MLSRMRVSWLLCLGFALVPRLAVAGEVKLEKDVTYGTALEVTLKMDVFQPSGFTGKRPGIVLIHGGGFIAGDKSFYLPMGKKFAEKGYVAFSLNYRLAPKHHYPAQVDDVQRAVRWIRAHAETYNLDLERIGALGDSAGGYLVAMLGTRDTRDNSDTELAKFSSRVQCVVDLYGPTDFTLPPATANISQQSVQLLTMFFGKKPGEDAELYKDGSPIVYVTKQSAPFLILHGTADLLVPVDQSQRLQDALKAVGVDSTLMLMYKWGHGYLKPFDPQLTGVLAEEFFARNLHP